MNTQNYFVARFEAACAESLKSKPVATPTAPAGPKHASRRVRGWKGRYLHGMPVVRALQSRLRRGYWLMSDEQQFLDDTYSLIRKYNPTWRG